jgi:catechol 2,3-dioxygenase-like lactoylglutathione lyase family enzyme
MLRVGDGPHFFSLSPVAAGERPGFSHIGLSVADFNVDSVRSQLENFGIRQARSPQRLEDRLALASTSWVKEYGATRELYFADREGIIYHLSSEAYCGGSGVLGETCSDVEAAPGPGIFRLVDYSHFTNFMGNRDRANDFYTRAFGKSYQAYQGPSSPVIGVGDGIQFLMYVGGDVPGTPEAPGRIDHVCFSVTNFDVETILAQLTDYGLSAREDPSDTQAMMHWISMRMPNRGGAEGGTPELYFSDPDGIRIQLQDAG